MLPIVSAAMGVEGWGARGLIGTARSIPQPPSAVAQKAGLDVVVPIRPSLNKRFLRAKGGIRSVVNGLPYTLMGREIRSLDRREVDTG